MTAHWKRDTITCMVILVIMFLFVGVAFALVFGYLFDDVESLLPKSVGVMFVISLFSIAICYLAVPKRLKIEMDEIEITREKNPEFFKRIDQMCEKAHIPTPRIYVIDDPTPNACAWGGSLKDAHVIINQGLLDTLDDEETYAVIGHELSHIAHRDTIVKGIAINCTKFLSMSAIIIGIMAMVFLGSVDTNSGRRSGGAGGASLILLAIAFAFLIFAAILVVTLPGAGMVTRFGVSRNREYLADAGSVEINGHPEKMISALRKLEEGCVNGNNNVNAADAMIFTVNPNNKKKRDSFMQRLQATHPSIDDRIKRLESMIPNQPKLIESKQTKSSEQSAIVAPNTVKEPYETKTTNRDNQQKQNNTDVEPSKTNTNERPPAAPKQIENQNAQNVWLPQQPIHSLYFNSNALRVNQDLYKAIYAGMEPAISQLCNNGFKLAFTPNGYIPIGLTENQLGTHLITLSDSMMYEINKLGLAPSFFNFMIMQRSKGWSSIDPRFMSWDRNSMQKIVPLECTIQVMFDIMMDKKVLIHGFPRPKVTILYDGRYITKIHF